LEPSGSPNLCIGEPFGIPVYIDKIAQECRKELPMIVYLNAGTAEKVLMKHHTPAKPKDSREIRTLDILILQRKSSSQDRKSEVIAC
jgi:hypothetical protein